MLGYFEECALFSFATVFRTKLRNYCFRTCAFAQFKFKDVIQNNGGVVNSLNIQDAIEASGGVPLYARMYAEDPDHFQQEINESVRRSIDGLRRSSRFDEWNTVTESVYAFEWPDGWNGIDADTWPEKDKF